MLSSPVDSAQLILRLYELRREPLLREARAWFLREFDPQSIDELLAIAGGPKNDWFRMVLGYWDMAASLVTFGAIDAEMFRAGNGEIVITFAKVEPFLEELRLRSGTPDFISHVESVVTAMPGATERMAAMRVQLRERATARARGTSAEATALTSDVPADTRAAG